MRYAVLFLVVLCGLCLCLAYRLGDSRGRMDCQSAQGEIMRQADIAAQRIRTDVGRIVNATAVPDIRRVLREKYTIAD